MDICKDKYKIALAKYKKTKRAFEMAELELNNIKNTYLLGENLLEEVEENSVEVEEENENEK